MVYDYVTIIANTFSHAVDFISLMMIIIGSPLLVAGGEPEPEITQ